MCYVCGILGNSLSFVLTVFCVMCFRFLSGSRDGTGSIVHIRERVIFWRIVVFYASENEAMFCNSIMNEILNKCFNIKMIILNENFIMKFYGVTS